MRIINLKSQERFAGRNISDAFAPFCLFISREINFEFNTATAVKQPSAVLSEYADLLKQVSVSFV